MAATARPRRPADGVPGDRNAAGWSQRLLTTGAKDAAVASSVNRTLASGPMAVHRDAAAAREPPSVEEAPTPRRSRRLASLARPEESGPTAGLAVTPGLR